MPAFPIYRRQTMDTQTTTSATTASSPTPWNKITGFSVGITFAVSLVLIAFVWPAMNATPRNLGLAIAAPAPMVEQIATGIDMRSPGSFRIIGVGSRAEAESLVSRREVYGALILDPRATPEIIIASAGSPIAAQLISMMGETLITAQGRPASDIIRTDVAPLPEGDPRGIGIASIALPLVAGGIAVGALALLVVVGWVRQLVTLVVGTLLVSAAAVSIMHGWFGAFSGNPWAEWGTLALGISAINLTILGLGSVLGSRAGVGLVAGVMRLIGNPLSGAIGGPEFYPSGLGALGQILPPGAVLTALRSVSGFGGAGSACAFMTLAIWVILGLLLFLIFGRTAKTQSAGK